MQARWCTKASVVLIAVMASPTAAEYLEFVFNDVQYDLGAGASSWAYSVDAGDCPNGDSECPTGSQCNESIGKCTAPAAPP